VGCSFYDEPAAASGQGTFDSKDTNAALVTAAISAPSLGLVQANGVEPAESATTLPPALPPQVDSSPWTSSSASRLADDLFTTQADSAGPEFPGSLSPNSVDLLAVSSLAALSS
jgi:hypothetical protein